VARQVETILKRYVLDSLHLLPSCGLQDLPRHSARAKLELLGRVRLTVQRHLEQSVR
jgi:methionine synthase II (cobalamin-independent)